ncbi:hypothetical protein C8F01DRAFT_1123070, partial [Mycena amicta]
MPMQLDVTNVSAAYAAMAKSILERSSPHPVSITLAQGDSDEPGPISAALVHTIVSFIHRWSNIDVDFDILPFLKKVPAQTLDRLTTATFKLSQGTMGPPCTLLLDAPRLDHASLEISDLSMLPLPWRQLTFLHLLTPHEYSLAFFGIIGQCASLRRLLLDVVTAWKETSLPCVSDIITLAHLEVCALFTSQEHCATIFTPFFAHFAFPALQILDISMDYYDDSHLGDAFMPFVVRCRGPNLVCLRIDHCAIDSEAVGIILRNIPSLEMLELERCWDCMGYEFFERLTHRETDLTPLVPRLETLSIFSSEVGEYEECILDMVLSRWWSDETLQALPTPPRVARWKEITICPAIGVASVIQKCTEEFETAMEDLRAQGLDVMVTFESFDQH